MTPTAPKAVEAGIFSPADREVALDASRALSRLTDRGCVRVEVGRVEVGRVEAGVGREPPQTFVLPAMAVRLLTDMLMHLADGRGVAVMPTDAELTTQQAADMLNVSRPYLIRLLEEGKIPFHLAGSHRRIKLDDILAYLRERDIRSKKVMGDLVDQAPELGFG